MDRSASKSNRLFFRINKRINTERDYAARCSVSDIDIANNRHSWIPNHIGQMLFVLLCIGFIHRFTYQNAGHGIKYTKFLEIFQSLPVFFRRHFFLTGFQKQDTICPILLIWE